MQLMHSLSVDGRVLLSAANNMAPSTLFIFAFYFFAAIAVLEADSFNRSRLVPIIRAFSSVQGLRVFQCKQRSAVSCKRGQRVYSWRVEKEKKN